MCVCVCVRAARARVRACVSLGVSCENRILSATRLLYKGLPHERGRDGEEEKKRGGGGERTFKSPVSTDKNHL